MKVLFLIQGREVAASRYRVLQYLPYLESRGVEAHITTYPSTVHEFFTFFRELPDYDCLFLQRKRFHGVFLKMLRKRAKKIIYDFDDAVMYKNSTASAPYSATRQRRFAAMVRSSDSVIAGNSFLREQAERYNDHVTTIPTVIDQSRYPAKMYDSIKENVTIGWIGDHGSIHYMESYRDVWEELGRKHKHAYLTIICDTFIETNDIPLVRRMWSSDREVEYLGGLDIGVMPLFDDLWSRGKCGFKIIQYLAVGVPAVCTPVGINRDVVEPGVNGFWAETREDWVKKLSLLVENATLRKEMGVAGRERVIREYTVQACAPRLVEWVKELGSRKQADLNF